MFGGGRILAAPFCPRRRPKNENSIKRQKKPPNPGPRTLRGYSSGRFGCIVWVVSATSHFFCLPSLRLRLSFFSPMATKTNAPKKRQDDALQILMGIYWGGCFLDAFFGSWFGFWSPRLRFFVGYLCLLFSFLRVRRRRLPRSVRRPWTGTTFLCSCSVAVGARDQQKHYISA